MTKADKKRISKAVKHLPPMQSKTRKEWRQIPGRGLHLEPLIINHKTEAEKMFKAAGWPGVEKYCADILEKNRLYYESKEIGASNIN